MKTKAFLTIMFLALAISASAQVEFLFTDFGRNVICREKALFWMDGDSDPCFNIVNYKKTGDKETFNLTPKEESDGKYAVTITLKDGKASSIVMKGSNITFSSNVSMKTEREVSSDLVNYFRSEAGYTTPSAASGVVSAKQSVPAATGAKDNKEESTVKSTFGKVKGLFKKKK